MTALTRRALLGSAALAATASPLAACSATRPDDLADLRRGFDGQVLQGGQPGWLERAIPTAQQYSLTPRAIAECASQADVQRAYAFARERGWPFAVRGGGHSYAGFSSTDGLLISTRALDQVSVDPRAQTITVGAGALLGPALVGLKQAKAGLMIPVGRCNGVGIAGLTLGGGWGFWARLYGLTSDSLLSTRIMTPDGVMREASADEHPDLFWALRGGGGGNFGINTSFTFRGIRVPERVTVFQAVWMEQQVIAEVLLEAMKLAFAGPREFSIEPVTSPLLNLALADQVPSNPVKLTIAGQFTGPREGLDRIIGPLLKRYPPRSKEAFEKDFWTAHQYLADATPIGWFRVESGFLRAALDADQMQRVVQVASAWPGSSVLPDSNWGFFSMGGAVSDVPADATAFPHRDAQALVKLQTCWADTDPEELIASGGLWLDAFAAEQRAHGLQGAYVNFCSRSLPDWPKAYYGANLDRLLELKRRWDPENAFDFEQGLSNAEHNRLSTSQGPLPGN